MEAIYRYGIDYRQVARAGVDCFFVETLGGNEIGSEGVVRSGFLYKIAATTLLTKAAIPDSRLVSLHGIHDMNENWDVLRHAPTLLEREAWTYPNLFWYTEQGTARRCIDGFLACLASEIEPSEWKWLQKNWRQSFSGQPEKINGATLIWSERTIAEELTAITEKRGATTHHILSRLLENGATIYSVTDVNTIDRTHGPLVVLNPQHFSENELQRILCCENSAVIMIGGEPSTEETPDFTVRDIYPPDQACLRVYGAKNLRTTFRVEPDLEGKERISGDIPGIEEPVTYCTEMHFRRISDAFISGCARVIGELASGAKAVNDEPVKILTLKLRSGDTRLLICNDRWSYVHPQINTGKNFRDIRVVTRFPYKPPLQMTDAQNKAQSMVRVLPQPSPASIAPISFTNKAQFMVRVPPKGIVVLDILD